MGPPVPDAARRRRARWTEWLRRYGPAELLAVLTAITGYAVMRTTGSEAVAAYGAAIGDNLGYYGVLLVREVRADAHAAHACDARYGPSGLARTGRALALEFGPAEALDATVVRPALTALAVATAGLAGGVILAKLAADLVFYVPVIATYELRRRAALQRAGAPDAPRGPSRGEPAPSQ